MWGILRNIGFLLLLLGVLGKAHECERECVLGDERTCMYEFHVESYHTMGRACYDCKEKLEDCLRQDCIAADGVSRPIIAVNKQLPGPAIQVCQGDRVVVDVYNDQLSDSEVIHWHGQYMRDHQYYDGVPFVTQCPFVGGVFRYDFPAAVAGTHFWHSHMGLHRGDGVFGAFVVRQAEDLHSETYEIDSLNHVLVLQDWIHTSVYDKFSGRHQSTNDDYASGILVNGKGRNSAAEIDGIVQLPMQLEVVNVVPGMRHRIRLINAGGLNCPIIVSVDNHTLTVITVDGDEIIPYTTNSLVVYSGERFDVILEANQPIDNYWIRLNGLIDCEQNKCFQGAVLRYEGASEEDPKASLSYDSSYPTGVVLNPLNSGGGGDLVTMVDLDSFIPSSLAQEVDKQFYLGFDFNQINNTMFFDPVLYPFNGVTEEWQVNTPQLNDISFKFPLSPPLSQPSDAQPTFCYYGEEPPCNGDFCLCTYVLKVGLGETVEMVLVDEGNIGDENHPFHLHGQNFHIVAMDRLGSHTSLADVASLDAAGGIKRKLEDSVKKDTVTIPDGGYTIIRFTADNPGWWLMHCHLVFHSEIGMVALLQVGEPDDLPSPPEGFPTCGSFMPPL